MYTEAGVAKALIRLSLRRTGGLRKYTQGSSTHNELISRVKSYMREHPKFNKLVSNAGMNAVTLANLIHDNK